MTTLKMQVPFLKDYKIYVPVFCENKNDYFKIKYKNTIKVKYLINKYSDNVFFESIRFRCLDKVYGVYKLIR